MIYRHDWVMMQIEAMASFVGQLLRGSAVQDDELTARIEAWMARGQYGKAEDELFRAARPDCMPALYTGLWFYRSLAALSPEELKQGDFSQQEVLQGMKDLARVYGILLPDAE